MADKTKTIKGATDKELDELIARLRKENEVQSLISDIKRKSASGFMPYDYGQEISTEKPIESLYHYGILGMKWGRKKARGIAKSYRISSDDHLEIRKILKEKRLNELSNAEIKQLTTRLQLEKQYRDLTKTEMSPGKKFVTEILGNAAKETAKTYVSKYMNKAVEELLKKAEKASK
jgi:DNA-binding transcriptional MerR regulator